MTASTTPTPTTGATWDRALPYVSGFTPPPERLAPTDGVLIAYSAREVRQQAPHEPVTVVEDSTTAPSPSTPAVGTVPPH